MTFLLHVRPDPGGAGWLCSRGRCEYDTHRQVDEAVAHMRRVAVGLGGAEIVVHDGDGVVDRISV